jgi:hypothetical protein
VVTLPGALMFTLDKVVPWGRSFDEYRSMFALTDDDLTGRVLGCADGPASFNAEATGRGARVVSCDPLYQFPTDAIRSRIDAIYDEVLAQTRANAETFVWSHIRSVDELGRVRRAAMEAFLRDHGSPVRGSRYVAAGLPSLPFAQDAFDLAVSSHFLFLYSDHHDTAFHVASVLDLCRVSREVRIFPLVTLGTGRSPHVQSVTRALVAQGYDVSIESVPYEFQRGGNEMMRVGRPT